MRGSCVLALKHQYLGFCHCITLTPSWVSYFDETEAVLPQKERGKASQGNILICRGVKSI